MSREADQSVCTKCVPGSGFEAWIADNGKAGSCSFGHGEVAHTVAVEDLAIAVDEYFRSNYAAGEEEVYFEPGFDKPSYRTRGDSLEEVMGEILGCEPDVFDAVVEALPDASHAEIKDGGEPFYDDLKTYESIEAAAQRDKEEEEDYLFDERVAIEDPKPRLQIGSAEELTLRAEVMRRLEPLEVALRERDAPTYGQIGHNQPPDDETAALDEVRTAVREIRAELEKSVPAMIEISAASEVTERAQGRLWKIIGPRVSLAADEFSKAVGKSAGSALTIYGIWTLLHDFVAALANWVTLVH
jgi:hypothetical protein